MKKKQRVAELEELGEGPHRNERADHWQEDMSRERTDERHGEQG
jgi:hypothetical protein